MIHGSSQDPVYLKKISLKIWKLRDELEAVVTQKMVEENISKEDALADVRKDYLPQNLIDFNAALEAVKSADTLDDSEDEMMKAMQESEAEEGKEEATANQDASTEQPEGDETQIVLVRPKLPPEQIVIGRTILAEVHMDRIYFFSDYDFIEGQSIVIEFQIPKRFIVNANIVYCRNYNMKSRIIRANQLQFRVCAEFSFLKKGERTLLRDFLRSVEPQLKAKGEGKAKKEKESEDDLFDELDNL